MDQPALRGLRSRFVALAADYELRLAERLRTERFLTDDWTLLGKATKFVGII